MQAKRHPKSPRHIIPVLGFAVILMLALVWISRRHPLSEGNRYASAVSGEGDQRKLFATYAGSQSCRECHVQEYDLWTRSHHGLAERAVRNDLDQSAFEPSRTFKHGSQATTARIADGGCQLVTLGFGSNIGPYRVERVIGDDPLRQFLTVHDGGRWQVFEAAYDPKSNQWFNVYGDEDRRPGEWGHWTGRGMNWNSMCASCHNTRLRKNYDKAADAYHTAMAEMTVGCEACHGPLKRHAEWRKEHPDLKVHDPTIVPSNAARMVGTCGTCHSRRDELTGDYRPGDSFFDHYSLAVLDESDRWYADGQVRAEDYEFASFLSSRMHQSGVVCMDCHNAHSGKTILRGNDLCMRCHQGNYPTFTNAPVIIPAEHGHHESGGRGGECIGCHMPVTTYMQRHPRHDHGFTIPDPLLTKQWGIPNACNRCHTDKSADWALDYTQKWYGTKMERHTRERARWIAAAQHGDASAKGPLAGMLAGGVDGPYWRAAAAGLLEPWASEPDVKTTLLARLKDEHPMVREAAVRAVESLVENGDAEVAEAVRPLLDDPVRNVRVAAAWMLRANLESGCRAANELQSALDLNSDQPMGQYRQAVFNLARRQPAQAWEHLEKAIEWDPFSPPLREEIAVVLSRLGRSKEAVEQLQAACKLEPQSAEARFKLGLAWAEMDNLQNAAEALEEAVRLDPNHARAWYNLGLARNSLGQTAEAIEALIRAETLAPADPQIPYARATILARSRRYAEARAAASRALELRRDFAEAQELLQSLPADQR